MAGMMKLKPGQNIRLKSTALKLAVTSCNVASAIGFIAVSDSGNQMYGASITSSKPDNRDIDVSMLSEDIEKVLVICSSDRGCAPFSHIEAEILCGEESYSLSLDLSGRNYTISLLGEFYRRNGDWKFRCLGDGFASTESASKALSVANGDLAIKQSSNKETPQPEPGPQQQESPVATDFDFHQTVERGRTMWNKFKEAFQSKTEELAAEVKKFKNKEFLNAAMAGSVLVAVADGSVSSEEKQKMIRFIQTNQALKVFDTKKVVETFNQFLEVVEFDLDAGRAECFAAVAKLKGKEDQARLVVRMVIAIGESDGDFDSDERKVVEEISKEMNITF